jgi:hypothetical protein
VDNVIIFILWLERRRKTIREILKRALTCQPSHVVKYAIAAALAAYDNDPNTAHCATAVGLLRAQGTHLGSEPGPEAV